MPAADRRWRQALGLALCIALVCIALAGYYLFVVAPMNVERGGSPFAGLSWSDAWQPVFWIVVVLAIFSSALHARKRERLRQRAISGQPDAVPPSIIVPDPADALDVSAAPLPLAWRMLRTPHAVLFSLALLVTLPAATLGSLFLLLWIGIRNAVLVLGVPIALLMVNLSVYALLMRRRAPHKRLERLVATHSGLVWQRTGRADVEMPWYDARLVEVWHERQGRHAEPLQGYTLYSRLARIEWRALPAEWIAPEGVTYSELAHRQRQLLDVIAAKTGLMPRTFADDLKRPEPGARASRSGVILAFALLGAICVLVFAALLGLAVASLLLPITPLPVVNAITAASLAGVAVFLTGLLVVAIVTVRRERTAIAAFSLPGLPDEIAATTSAAGLGYKSGMWAHAENIVCGLLLAWQIVPMCMAFVSFTTYPASSPQSRVQALVLSGFLLCVVVGAGLLWSGLRNRSTYVWADVEGLHKRDGRHVHFLPWEAVQSVQVEMIAGKAASFEVRGATRAIGWPASDARILPPRDDDARALTPDELAAVVVERSGRTLTVG
jgi:hypothetical protein